MKVASEMPTTIETQELGRRLCPGCGNREGRRAGSKNGFEILVCGSCKTIYTDRLPASSETEDYDHYYSETNLTAPEFVNVIVAELIAGFEKYRTRGRLLDIGFGSGNLLHEAREQGWEVYGIEVSAPAFEQAKSRGFNVFHGDLVAAAYENEFFDVVCASEILEHLPDPQNALKEVARILRPGGLLWATTPSAGSLSFRISGAKWSVISPPEHTQLFSKKAVSDMLSKAGFSRIRLRTHGFNPTEVINNLRNVNPEVSRVESGYRLNENLTRTPIRRGVKRILNGSLNALRLGDSLKIFAER